MSSWYPGKSEKPRLAVFGFPARSGEYVEKDKQRRKEVFCTLCKNLLNYTGSTTNMIVHLQYRHMAEYNELVSILKSKPSDGRTMCTPVYIKMDIQDQLLLAEGVCRQLGIVNYHPEVETWRGGSKGRDNSNSSDGIVTVPLVRVSMLQSVRVLPITARWSPLK